jgi:hypothetical protein
MEDNLYFENVKRCMNEFAGLRNVKKHLGTEHEARNSKIGPTFRDFWNVFSICFLLNLKYLNKL